MAGRKRRAEERLRKRMIRMYIALGAIAVAAVVVTAAWVLSPGANQPPPITQGRQCAVVVMPQGNITMVLYNDLVPTTAGRFGGLLQSGYYNGLTWHRVENWVIQTGQGSSRDPINLEINPTVKNVRGSVAAARTSDPNSATTQFYILKSDASWLDGNYSVFGTVLSGMNLVDSIQVNAIITRTAQVACPS